LFIPHNEKKLITFDEVVGFLKNPPLLLQRLDILKICALCKHLTQELKQLDCPQSLIYGWAGLAMDPTMYNLIETFVFTMPPDPGNFPTYPQFATIQNIKTADCMWKNARNYYLFYISISHKCFRMLNELAPDHFKMSNDPALLG
jgi:hypothetical protein